jgi:O-acetylhomoserine (thiol)-lyase
VKLESIALHHGYKAEETTKAAAVPIYQTTSYTFDNTQHGADLFNLAVPGNIYTRIMNPTTAVLEQRVAEMEGGIAGLCVASGMAAITYSIQAIAGVGDNIVSISQLYGGTYNLFMHSFPRQGIEVRLADQGTFAGSRRSSTTAPRPCSASRSATRPATSSTSQRLAEIAHRHGVPVIVDNTVAFAVSAASPIEFGADIVVHALTKYIGGHGNSPRRHHRRFRQVRLEGQQGALPDPERARSVLPRRGLHRGASGPAAYIGRCRVVPLRNTGAAFSPHNAFLFLTGLETLGCAMERHCENAEKIANPG